MFIGQPRQIKGLSCAPLRPVSLQILSALVGRKPRKKSFEYGVTIKQIEGHKQIGLIVNSDDGAPFCCALFVNDRYRSYLNETKASVTGAKI